MVIGMRNALSMRRCHLAPLLWSLFALVLAVSALPAAAQPIRHFGKNRLQFAPVAPMALPEATGTGVVD